MLYLERIKGKLRYLMSNFNFNTLPIKTFEIKCISRAVNNKTLNRSLFVINAKSDVSIFDDLGQKENNIHGRRHKPNNGGDGSQTELFGRIT